MYGKKLGFLGCGNMGEAILKAVISNRLFSSNDIFVCEADKKKSVLIRRKYKVGMVSNNELADKTDVLILAVKPQTFYNLDFSEFILYKKRLIISILAGLPIRRIESSFGRDARIARVMPNLGLIVGAGMSAGAYNKNVTVRCRSIVKKIFGAAGKYIEVSESKLDAVTAVSGSGPAYYFYLTELLINEALSLGISEHDAVVLAKATAKGAALLMDNSELSPSDLRACVTSPGGTTEAAFKVLLQKGYVKLFSKAVRNAFERAKEISCRR